MYEQRSKIAQFRQQQYLNEQGAMQGLHGYAKVASHESITTRMEKGADSLLELIEAGKFEEVERAWSGEWC